MIERVPVIALATRLPNGPFRPELLCAPTPMFFGHNQVIEAGGGGEPDPTAFSGATLWVDGSPTSLPGLADGGAVGSSTNWIDRITLIRNFSQGTAGSRPILHMTGGPNNRPYVQFADANDIVTYSTTYSTVYSTTALTGFAVLRPQRNGANTGPEFCPNIFGNTNGYIGITMRNTGSGNKFVYYQYNGGYATVSSTTTFSQNVWYIIEWWYDGTNINLRVNNDTTVSTAKNQVGSLAETPNIGQEGLTSDVAGLYIWNADIGSTNRGLFKANLASWFNITLL